MNVTAVVLNFTVEVCVFVMISLAAVFIMIGLTAAGFRYAGGGVPAPLASWRFLHHVYLDIIQ